MKMLTALLALGRKLKGAFWEWHYETFDEPSEAKGPEWSMTRYVDGDMGNAPWYPRIVKIIVADEKSKTEFLEGFHYLHNCAVDTDFMAINELVHLYRAPHLIDVQREEPSHGRKAASI